MHITFRFFLFLNKQSYLRIYWKGTLPWQPILGKIGEMIFIQHPGILKLIGSGAR